MKTMKDYREYLFPMSWIAFLSLAIYLFFVINWIIVVAFIALLGVTFILVMILYLNFLWWPQSTWIDKSLIDFTNVEIPSSMPGENLKGFIVNRKNSNPNEKHVGILCHHGYLGKKDSKPQFYIPLALDGCIILCIDARGHGESISKKFRREDFKGIFSDVKNEIDFLEKIDGVDPNKLIMIGHSMGGSATLIGGFKDPRLKKIVAMSTPFDHLEMIEKNKTLTTKLLKKRILKESQGNLNQWNESASSKFFLGKKNDNNDRVFLVHCKHDDLIPFDHAVKIKESLQLSDENVLFLEKPDYKYWGAAHQLIGQESIVTQFLLSIIKSIKK